MNFTLLLLPLEASDMLLKLVVPVTSDVDFIASASLIFSEDFRPDTSLGSGVVGTLRTSWREMTDSGNSITSCWVFISPKTYNTQTQNKK